MTTQNDLFGEPRIQVKGNPVLEKAANHLLLLLQNRERELLNGETVGEIDRRLCAEYWLDEGLRNIIPEDKRQAFVDFMLKATEADVITRARRYLTEQDVIRLPAVAVQNAERHRARIASAMR